MIYLPEKQPYLPEKFDGVLVTASRPFGTETMMTHAPEGLSISQLLWNGPQPKNIPITVECWIDGKPISCEYWDATYPKTGQLVAFKAYPAGSGLRTILSVLVMIVAAVFTLGLATPLIAAIGLGTMSAGLAGGIGLAISVVGNLLINAFIPVKSPRQSDFSATNDAPTQWISGAQNSVNKWGAIPVLLGCHRTTPFYGAKPYTEIVGNDQFLRCLFIIGYGPLQITDLKLGDAAIDTFQDVEIEIRSGYEGDDPISLIPNQVDELSLQVLLENTGDGGTWNSRTTEEETDEFSIDWNFPSGLAWISRTGEKTPWLVQLEVRYKKVGDEEWTYVVDDLPVPATQRTLQSSWLPLFSPYWEAEGAQWVVGTRIDVICIKKDTGYVQIFQSSTVFSGGTPELPQIDPLNYYILAHITVEGNEITNIVDKRDSDYITGCEVTLSSGLIVNIDSGTVGNVDRLRTVAATNSAVRRTLTILPPERGQYEVQVRRTTADSGSTTIIDLVYWIVLRSIKHESPVNFPHPLAMVALRMRATDQLSGIVDNFNCIATSIIKDYDPEAIEVEDNEGSTFNRGDFTATNAFFWSSLDLSPYAGTESGFVRVPLVTFIFDDDSPTHYTVMKPVFDAQAVPACMAIITDQVGGANISWAQILECQADGWEILSHTKSHPDLTILTEEQMIDEIGGSKTVLEGQGISIKNFAYPYGASNVTVRGITAQYYHSGRGVSAGINVPFVDFVKYNLHSQSADDHTKLADFEALVDAAESVGGWLMFHLHDTDLDDAATIDALITYIKGKGINIVTVEDALSVSELSSTITPFYIEVLDVAGKKATGYLAGIGEDILGDERITNGNMETGDPPTGWNGVAGATLDGVADERDGGSGIQSLSVINTGTNGAASQNISGIIGGLYNTNIWGKKITGNFSVTNPLPNVGSGEKLNISWTNYIFYGTAKFASGNILLFAIGGAATEARYDDISVKRINEPPSTAVHIVSSLNGTTRAWESIESGFNPNSIASWKIYQLGAWIEKPTNNPASLYRYVLQGTPNTKPQADEKLDLDWFETFWQWCADNNYMYNGVVSSAKSVFELCTEVCAVARCSPQRNQNGLWAGVIDKERDTITGHYTPHNSWNFEFSGMFPQLPHGIRVTFIDEAHGYQQQERIIYDDGYNEENATLFEAVAQQGITNPDHIFKMWRYNIACTKLRPFPFSFMVDWEHLTNTRGDLIRVSYYELSGQLFSGRIKDIEEVGDDHVLTLDNTVIMQEGKSYAIRIRQQDGTTLTGDILTEAGETNIITVSGFLSPVPNDGDLFQFGELQAESIPAIIKSIEPVDKLCAKVNCLDYAPAVFNADTELIPEWNPIVTLPYLADNKPSIPEITNVISDESVIQRDPGGRFKFRIAVSFRYTSSTKVNAQYVQAQYGLVEESGVQTWETSTNIPALDGFFFIDNVQEGGQYQIRLRALTRAGISSEWSTPYLETVIGRTSVPDDVTGFDYSFTQNGILFNWDRLTTIDINYYELRYGGTCWEDATLIARINSDSYEWQWGSLGTYTIRIKAVDFLEKESATNTILQLSIVVPKKPTNLRSQVIHNQVLLFWECLPGSFPISYFKVFKGDEPVGTTGGNFISFFEVEGEVYIYKILAVDFANNEGESASISVMVNDPFGFVLDQEEALTISGGVFTNAFYDADTQSIYMPVDIESSYDDFMDDWESWQVKIDAGYPLWLQPTPATGEWLSDTLDLGEVISSSKIEVTLLETILAAGCTVIIYIRYSENGEDWTEVEGSVIIASNFRYFRVRITVSQAGNTGLIKFN